MDTLKDALYLIRPNCWMASIDIKDAYYSFRLAEPYRKYFKFIFEHELYEFKALCQGFGQAPRIFTKCLRPVLATLRARGIDIMAYLDDSFITADSVDECSYGVKATMH